MGMSGDYKEALKNGSTFIRIGTKLFKQRNENKINIFTEELNKFKGVEKFKLKDLIACNNDSRWLEKIPHKTQSFIFTIWGFLKNHKK